MQSGKIIETFLRPASSIGRRTDPFTVTARNGFLPFNPPARNLPPGYERLQELLEEMPLNLPGGGHGHLYHGRIHEKVHTYLPYYKVNLEDDSSSLFALFRAYARMCSAYAFEPYFISNLDDASATAMVARERDVIPANIAVPLAALANYFGMFPWLSYAKATLYSWHSKIEIDTE